LKHKESLLFVNKKKQKNFVNLGFARTGLPTVIPVHSNKSFLLVFFKKDASFLPCNLMISPTLIPDRR